MAAGKDEAISVEPVRVFGIVFQDTGEQHIGGRSKPHRSAGVS